MTLSSLLRRAGLFSLAAGLSTSAFAGEVRFSPEDGHAYTPVFSADGKWIAFEVNRYDGGSIDMYVAAVAQNGIAKDGVKVALPGGGTQFGASGQVVMNPTWHPQGLAVFEGSNQGGLYRLYIYSPGGASATELLDTTRAPGNLTFPSISPDGNNVAYVSDQTGKGDVKTWNRSTNAFGQVTTSDGTESFPSYAKDGKTMLFTRKQNNTEDVFVYDTAAKTEKSLVGGGGDQTRPVYAAGNAVVYFTSERGAEAWDIAVVDSAGQNKKILAKDVRLPLRTRPALSKDGNWVAWVSADPTKDMIVNLTKIDGSATVQITTDFKGCGEPALTEQNGRILLAYTYLPQSGADWRHLFVVDVTDKLQ
jgi:Tol biopolymer transport system component